MSRGGLADFTIEFDADDGSAVIHGQVTPSKTRVVMHTALPQTEPPRGRPGMLAVKVPGHHYYSAQGAPWSYAPAQFVVFEVIRYDRRIEEDRGYGEPDERNRIVLDVTERMRWDLRA